MPIVLGTDLGTTKLTVVAVDADTGAVAARATAPNSAEVTRDADKSRGRSEWDSSLIAAQACACFRKIVEQLGGRRGELAGVGITGQQHGVVLVDEGLNPVTPLINWQDRRGEEPFDGGPRTFVRRAVELAGPDAPARAGCRLAAGYLAVTLFWLKERGLLPARATACFLMDYFATYLTGKPPVTDPTCAASGGILNVRAGDWDAELLAALGLPRELLPPVRPSGELLGGLSPSAAAATGLPAGLPVFVGIGDNQASFLGSVADHGDAALVNVGTGGQVAAYTERFRYDPRLETRPFPRGGYLLASAGLSGGAAYAVLERFYRSAGVQLFSNPSAEPLFARMNELAAQAPPGAGGLRCEPFFAGTRAQPDLRGSWTGVSTSNFTPAHVTRALLEGMARAFRGGYDLVAEASHPRRRLVGAGNGLRENPVLAQIVAGAFGMTPVFAVHQEEAAYGAALLASVGAGVNPDLVAAGRLIRYSA